MRRALLFLLISSPINCLAQVNSDLYRHVDFLIRVEIEYISDSTTDQLPKSEWDSTKTLFPSIGKFAYNPSPLIMLDGEKVKLKGLNDHTLSEVASINLFKKGDNSITALYGQLSLNGAIFIQTKEFRRRKKRH